MDHDSFAILDVVEELSDVNPAIGVDLLAMLVADTVFELSNDLGALSHVVVAAVARHLGVMELPRVLVAVIESRDSFAF